MDMNDSTRNDGVKSDTVNPEDSNYPSSSYVEELGSDTAEAICASMRATNDNVQEFGGTVFDPDALANAMTHLRCRAPLARGRLMQKFRVISGVDD